MKKTIKMMALILILLVIGLTSQSAKAQYDTTIIEYLTPTVIPQIAHITSAGTIIFDIPIDTIESYLLQTIYIENEENISISYLNIERFGNLIDGYQYMLVFRVHCGAGICLLYGTELGCDEGKEDEDPVIYPLAPEASKVENTCAGDPCSECHFTRSETTGQIKGCRCADAEGRCNHTKKIIEGGVIQLSSSKNATWDYAAFFIMLGGEY